MKPMVSVVIATYNQCWCLEETIQSVLGQTYTDIEVIVVDDASTDDTPARVASFGNRVRYIRHRYNQDRNHAGAAATRNTGILAARGQFIAFLDGDDLWQPEKLAVQVAAAERAPHAGLIAVDGIEFDHEDGRLLKNTLFNGFATGLPEGTTFCGRVYKDVLDWCIIDTPSQILVPSRVFDQLGGFDLLPCSDYDFLLRLAAHYEVVLLKTRLVRYRYRPSNASGPLRQQHFRFASPNVRIWKKHAQAARRGYRHVIHERIAQEVEWIAERALAQGCQGDRMWASRYLWGLFLQTLPSTASLGIVPLLARLWCPRWIAAWVHLFRPGVGLGVVRRSLPWVPTFALLCGIVIKSTQKKS